MARARFIGYRLDHNFPGAIRGRLVVDFESNLLLREVLEIGVYVLRGLGLLPLHSDQIVSSFDLKAGLGERRARALVPVFAGIDLADAVVAAVRGKVRREQAHTDLW